MLPAPEYALDPVEVYEHANYAKILDLSRIKWSVYRRGSFRFLLCNVMRGGIKFVIFVRV